VDGITATAVGCAGLTSYSAITTMSLKQLGSSDPSAAAMSAANIVCVIVSVETAHVLLTGASPTNSEVHTVVPSAAIISTAITAVASEQTTIPELVTLAVGWPGCRVVVPTAPESKFKIYRSTSRIIIV